MTDPRVYLVRHAKAEKENPGGDARRRLTAEGRERFSALLRELGAELAVTRVLTSPVARARETAELLARAAGCAVEEHPALASGTSGGREILELAARAGAGAALVGHNPELAEAVAIAAGREEELKPGAVAAVDLLAGSPRLAWLRRPPKVA
ncbi:MAG TPA: histidine phosphatase family protein [Anaeromyxobacteraceae bacterium]